MIRLKLKIFFLLISVGFLSPLYSEAMTAKQQRIKTMTSPLIPRKTLFGNSQNAHVRLSPDGKNVAYIAPRDGVLNLWLSPVSDTGLKKAKPLTKDTKRGIQSYFWTYTNQYIVYLQDQNGDENWHLYRVNIETGEIDSLTPFEGVQVRVMQVSSQVPGKILIGMNKRDPEFFDVYLMDIRTGNLTLVEKNDQFSDMISDNNLNLRLGVKVTPDGGSQIHQRKDEKWVPFQDISFEDFYTTSPITFDDTGETLYMRDSRGRDTSALYAVDMQTQKKTLLATDEAADCCDILIHPKTKKVQGFAANYERKKWQILDDGLKDDFAYLRQQKTGDIEIVSRTLNDHLWIVAYLQDSGPVQYYLYNRDTRKVTYLFASKPELNDLPLVPMHPVMIPTRDALTLVSYLSLPDSYDPSHSGRPSEPLPLVLVVHGGPWARDHWGYNSMHQWLANRGYAVLSVNFRSSTGFGKAFVNAGDGEWAGKMHEDLLDAVNWAVKNKIANPKKVAIMGGSYGGYAALVGLTLTPEIFACGVDIVGPSNLMTLLETIPPYWKPVLNNLERRIGGNLRTQDGIDFLKSRSPIHFVDQIQRPLLIGQGANDPRVKQSESDQIVKKMQEKQLPVTYALYPDEGHGFTRPENRLSFFALTEKFLAQHLGGAFEPIGDDFQNSSVEIREDGNQLYQP